MADEPVHEAAPILVTATRKLPATAARTTLFEDERLLEDSRLLEEETSFGEEVLAIAALRGRNGRQVRQRRDGKPVSSAFRGQSIML
jgi:hypothetical protein